MYCIDIIHIYLQIIGEPRSKWSARVESLGEKYLSEASCKISCTNFPLTPLVVFFIQIPFMIK